MTIEFLEIILLSDTPSELIKKHENEIFQLIPELESCKGFDQKNPWHIYDVYEHILKVTDLVPKNRFVRFAALFHDVGKPSSYREDENGIGHFYGHWEVSAKVFQKFAEDHCLDAELTSSVLDLIFYHDINFAKLTDEEYGLILKKFGSEKIKLLFSVKRADLKAQNPKYHYLLENYDLQEKQALEKLQPLC